MKNIFHKIFLNTIAIAVVAYITPGLSYNGRLSNLLTAALVLAFINMFLRPLIKILMLPINIITLGLSGWLVNVVVLYLTDLLVPGLSVQGFTSNFFGTTFVLSIFWAYVFISFLINLVSVLVNWVTG